MATQLTRTPTPTLPAARARPYPRAEKLQIYAVSVDDGDLTLAPAEPFAGIRLAYQPGLSVGMDAPSFCGQPYEGIVKHLAGVDLRQHLLTPTQVDDIALALDAALNKTLPYAFRAWGLRLDEVQMLARWFAACASEGYYVHGWWGE